MGRERDDDKWTDCYCGGFGPKGGEIGHRPGCPEAVAADGTGEPSSGDVTPTGRVHDLKTWPVPFRAVRAGLKWWELRFNDRDYQVGDLLRLNEWHPGVGAYTEEAEERLVVWKLDGGAFGLPEGYVILSLALAAPAPSIPAGWVEKEERAHGVTIDQRDAAEEALSQAFYLVTGRSPKWSNVFGYPEALEEIGAALAPAPSPVVEGGDQGSKPDGLQLASGNAESAEPSSAAGAWRPGLGPVNCQRVQMWEATKPYPRTCERCRLGPCPFWNKDRTSRLDAQGVTGGAEPCPACLGEGCGVCNERGAA